MNGMFSTFWTKFSDFKSYGVSFFLGGIVIAGSAFRTDQGYFFSHGITSFYLKLKNLLLETSILYKVDSFFSMMD